MGYRNIHLLKNYLKYFTKKKQQSYKLQFSVTQLQLIRIFNQTTSMSFLFLEIDQNKINGNFTQQIEGPFFITNPKSNLQKFKSSSDWNSSEKIKFSVFFYKNESTFTQMDKQLKWKVVAELARFVKTRNLCQCKSFYTKIQRQYQSIYDFIQKLKQEIENFQEQFQLFLNKFQQFSRQTSSNPLEQQKLGQNIRTDTSYPFSVATAPQKKEYKKKQYIGSLPKKAIKIFYPQLSKKIEGQQKLHACHTLFIQWLMKANEIFQQK